MDTKSIEDMINRADAAVAKEGNRLELSFPNTDLNTILTVDVESRIATISDYGLTLTYDPEKFQDESYAVEQLAVHEEYCKHLKGGLSLAYDRVYALMERERELERISQFLPESAVRKCLNLTRILVTPFFLVSTGKTLQGMIKESVKVYSSYISSYKLIKAFVDYGKTFVDAAVAIEQSPSLESWSRAQGDISYGYSRLIETAEKRVKMDQKWLNSLFPDSKTE